jgi:hypothetical protein
MGIEQTLKIRIAFQVMHDRWEASARPFESSVAGF